MSQPITKKTRHSLIYSSRLEIPEAGYGSSATQSGCAKPKAAAHTGCGILTGLVIVGLVLMNIPLFFSDDPQAIRRLCHYFNPYHWPIWYAVNLWLVFAGLLTVPLLKNNRVQTALRAFYASRFSLFVKTRIKRSQFNQSVVRFFLRKKTGKYLLRKWLLFLGNISVESYPAYAGAFALFAVFIVIFTYSALMEKVRLYLLSWLIFPYYFILYQIYEPFYLVPLVEFNIDGKITWRLFIAPLTALLLVVWLIRRMSKSKKKKDVPYILSTMLILFSCGILHAADTPRRIILVEEAKRVNERDIREASKSESEKNTDGGYNANASVIDCFAAMEYRYTGGRYVDEPIRFRMLFPAEIKPGKKYPLVLWFHGVGESGKSNTRQLAHLQSTIEYLAGKNKLDFFMIVTQCPADNTSWSNSISSVGKGDAPLTIAEEIMDAVLEEYPIDRNRLGVLGICSGGNAVWQLVARHPGRFAAMAACSSTPSGNPGDFVKTAVWAFNNKGDSAPWKTVEQFIKNINAAGGNACVTLKEGGSHDSWSNALYKEKVIGWMVLQSLEKRGPPQGVICYHRTTKQVFLLFGLPIVAILSVIPFYYRNRGEV